MSRIGKIPISVPKDLKVKIDNSTIHLEGPKGKFKFSIPHAIKVEQKDDQFVITRQSETKQVRTDHGTVRANLANMVVGLTKGHKKDLEIQGIGFRAQLEGKKITFNLGLSHPVEFVIPDDVQVTVTTPTAISVEGFSRERVGLVASQIRALKPVEPYKGKGIRYAGENVRRKQGKSVAK